MFCDGIRNGTIGHGEEVSSLCCDGDNSRGPVLAGLISIQIYKAGSTLIVVFSNN